MPFSPVFLSFLQCARVWLLGCSELGCFCPSEGLWVRPENHHLTAALAAPQRQEKPSLFASFLEPDSHTFYT
jgi:hypothetical protein